MAFLREQIKEQKILEMEVNFDNFIKENNISENAMIQRVELDKDVYASEEEAREYLKSIFFAYDAKITELDSHYDCEIMAGSQFDLATENMVELRRGVKAFAYDLRPIEHEEEIRFNQKGVKSFVSKIDTIDLNNGLPHIIEIAKVAKGYHPRYGTIELTEEHLKSFVKNFNARVTDVDLAVNEDHEKKEAFGWYKDVFLSVDGKTLYGSIVWNTKGVSALSNKDYRYFSPEFNFNYTHEHTGVEHGATLVGGALTNYPFLKMNAIVELNNKNHVTKEKIVSKENPTIDLNVHNAQIVDLNSKISSMQIELSAKTTENETLKNEVKQLKDTIELNNKKQAHQKLFNDGHINAAQLTALNEGKGMLEVLSLNSKEMNKEATGGSKIDEDVNLNDGEAQVAKQLGLTPEEFKSVKL